MTLTTALMIPNRDEMQTMTEMSKMLASSGMIPEHLSNKPGAVFAIMQKGKELSIPPMYAMNNITVISGKATANSELMLALIFRDHGDDAIHFSHSDADRCTIEYKRRGGKPGALTYTMQEAIAAGHPSGRNGATWKKYPANMLRARCVSAVARMAFPDSIGGMYTPEELDAEVDEQGDVLVARTQQTPAPPPAPETPRPPRRTVTVPDGIEANVPNDRKMEPSPGDAAIEAEFVDDGDEPISKGLSRKLWAVARQKGWDEDALKAHIARNYPDATNEAGEPSAKGLTQGQARAILDLVEALDGLLVYAAANDWQGDDVANFVAEKLPHLANPDISEVFLMNAEELAQIDGLIRIP